jgi:hypothetical protein
METAGAMETAETMETAGTMEIAGAMETARTMETTSNIKGFKRPFPPPPEHLIDQMYPHVYDDVPKVIIRHPAYSDDSNVLLVFYAWDHAFDDPSDHSIGVHLGTALLACRLVACNEFDGISHSADNRP